MRLFTDIGIAKNQTIYLAAAAALIFGLGIWGGMSFSDGQITRLEKRIEETKAAAEMRQAEAIKSEREAEQFKAKIAFLEQILADRDETARRQDEEIKKISSAASGLRAGVNRARGVSRIESTITELCAKLREIGHACE